MKDLKKAILLLQEDPNKQEHLSSYIREIRSCLQDLIVENQIMRKKGILPKVGEISRLFKHNLLDPQHYFFDKGNDDYLFITITFDPRKFPQLIVATEEDQKQYIEQVLTKAHSEDIINSFYGIYELQKKTQNIHIHIIANKYNSEENKDEIINFLTPYFTDREKNKYCIDVRPITNIEGLITDYLKKDIRGVCHNLSDDTYYDLDLNPAFKYLGI